MWLGSVASISRRPSHWPTKFSVNAAAFGSFEHPLDLAAERLRVARVSPSRPGSSNSSSGIVLQRKYDSRAGQGEVVELAGLLAEEQEIRRHHHAVRPTRTACSNDCFAASCAFTSSTNGLTSASVTARRKARRAKSRRIRSASASGFFETTSTRLLLL